MFEKEAKEYGDNYVKSKYMETVDETWRKGAEFGYNKANEWHYVKDGNLPKDENDVLVLLENGNVEISGISTDKRWLCTDYYTGEDKVYAWKEIVLPKESE